LILSSIADEPLDLTNNTEFEGESTRLDAVDDGTFKPLLTSTPGKRKRETTKIYH